MVSEIIDDVDPAAEFLAREQDVLASIEDDDIVSSATVATGSFNGGITEPETSVIPPHTVIDNPSPVNQQMNGDQTYREPPPEPETIHIWREQQQRLLAKKDEEELKRKNELKEQCKKDLDEWYARYRESLEKSKAANRSAEEEWKEERDRIPPGKEWERVALMCDFNPKSSGRNQRDTSRMKSIMLQLKQVTAE